LFLIVDFFDFFSVDRHGKITLEFFILLFTLIGPGPLDHLAGANQALSGLMGLGFHPDDIY